MSIKLRSRARVGRCSIRQNLRSEATTDCREAKRAGAPPPFYLIFDANRTICNIDCYTLFSAAGPDSHAPFFCLLRELETQRRLPPPVRTGKHLLLSFSLLLLCIQTLPAAESPKDPIRIGASVSMEGKYHEPSMMIIHAYRLWAEEINRKGGLLGRKVELILSLPRFFSPSWRCFMQPLPNPSTACPGRPGKSPRATS